MNITNELLLEYKKHHNKEFKFCSFGDNNRLWECYTKIMPRGRCADCLFDYNPKLGTLSMYTDFHLEYDALYETVYVELYGNCNIKSWEEFEMYMKRYKVFERAALKFKKELIIESKKLELEDDFNADDD